VETESAEEGDDTEAEGSDPSYATTEEASDEEINGHYKKCLPVLSLFIVETCISNL
jgi:hypothetical protein